jgi:hypothetical protein
MSKNNDIAESIIRCEGLAFALASKVGKDGDLREARDLLKTRLIKELMAAELRGALSCGELFMIGFAPPLPEHNNLNEYVNVVQYALKSELTDDEIVLAAEARAGKMSAPAFADWLSACRATELLPIKEISK